MNLAWGVDQALATLADGRDAVLAAALDILESGGARNRALSERGADWLPAQVDGPSRYRRTATRGTALGVVRSLHLRGLLRHVDETRPLLQGARLTAWEPADMGAARTLVVDSAGATVLARGLAQAVVVGADRITANGDVVNKIGTYPPAPASGADVEIEVRAGREILGGLPGTPTPNLAFDVTPADLVTAIVTEDRLVRPAAGERLA